MTCGYYVVSGSTYPDCTGALAPYPPNAAATLPITLGQPLPFHLEVNMGASSDSITYAESGDYNLTYTLQFFEANGTTPVNVTAPASSIFTNAETPTLTYTGGPVELGVRFRSDIAGTITGIRFYKVAGDNSTHTGSLWSNNGQLLATGTFSNETASGWQTLTFNSPVSISANTTYVASYHTGGAFYYEWDRLKNAGIDNPPLHILKDGVDGGNGLYHYGPGGSMPTEYWASSNYWVDVTFKPAQ